MADRDLDALRELYTPDARIRHNFDDKEYEFVSTYRRRFKLPQAAAGKRVFIDFEGAMTASNAWINGVHLGEYKGGFTPFSFELTKHLHPMSSAPSAPTMSRDLSERSISPARTLT